MSLQGRVVGVAHGVQDIILLARRHGGTAARRHGGTV
ncbi:hypothetical protein RKD33_006349 [Streptomyces sp. SAI-129]